MEFKTITKDYIRTHKFEFDGLTYPQNKEEVSYRLHPNDALPLDLANNQITLRKKFVNLFYRYFDGDYDILSARAYINESAMRKYLRGSRKDNGRNITREAVAKMSVSTRLSVEEANELFCLQGHSLDPEHGLFDAIVVDALECGDDICAFYETCAVGMPAAIASRLEGNHVGLRHFVNIIGGNQVISMYRPRKVIRYIYAQGKGRIILFGCLCRSNQRKHQRKYHKQF